MDFSQSERDFVLRFLEKISKDSKQNSKMAFIINCKSENICQDNNRIDHLWDHFQLLKNHGPYNDIPQIEEETNKGVVVKNKEIDMPVQIIPTGGLSKKVKEFLVEELNECNSIPEKVNLTLCFTESTFHMGQYEYKTKKGGGTRISPMINAIIKYEPKASKLVMGVNYPLAVSKNGLLGLYNYLNATKKHDNLNGRTFIVNNTNRHTYIWEEVKDQ